MPAILNKKKIMELLPYAVLGFTEPIQVNQSVVDQLDSFLTMNSLRIEQLFNEVEPDCSDIFIKCKWKGKERNCSELFVTTLTKDGTCCTLNTTIVKGYITGRSFYYGYQMGLSVIIESVFGATEPENIVSSISSLGAKVLIHNVNEFAGTSSIEKVIGNGTETFIRLLGTRLFCSEEVESLTIEQRSCLFVNEQKLKYFSGDYIDSHCELECKMDKILAVCNCVLYMLPKVAGKKVCQLKDVPCLSKHFPAFYRHPSTKPPSQIAEIECSCLPQCNDIFYNVQAAGMALRNVPYTASPF